MNLNFTVNIEAQKAVWFIFPVLFISLFFLRLFLFLLKEIKKRWKKRCIKWKGGGDSDWGGAA